MQRIIPILLISLLAAASAFAACPKGSTTLFFCTTTSGKQIELCDAGKNISYSFGKAGKPEIALSVPRAQASTSQWNGMGRYISYSVDVPNGDSVYSVYFSADKLSDEHPIDAGVAVTIKGKHAATVKCSQKSINKGLVNNLEGVELRPTE